MYQNKKKSPSRLSSAEAAKEMSSTKSKMQNTGMSMAMDVLKKAALEGHMEAASKRTKSSIFDDPYVKSRMAEDKIRKQRKAVKTGTKTPKPKAKMLPEVKVTAPGKLKRFVSKLTSKRK